MNISTKEFVENALRTESNDFDAIRARLSDERTIRLLHAAMGLVTEASECLDMLKKHIFYGKPLDLVNFGEELGDVAWYQAIGADAMEHDSLDIILATVIKKLRTRYPEKFTSEDAINRDLKAESAILEENLNG